MSERFLLVEEVANETRTCVATVRYWIKNGKLKAIRIGRRLLVSRADLDALLAGSAPHTSASCAGRNGR